MKPYHAVAQVYDLDDRAETVPLVQVFRLLDQARARHGLRVQGVLVGDRETIGLLEICDAIHWVRDWRRYAADPSIAYADGHSPVHSKSLTALYFPNALNARASATAARRGG